MTDKKNFSITVLLLSMCFLFSNLANAAIVVDDTNVHGTVRGADRFGWEWTVTLNPNPPREIPTSPGATAIEHRLLNSLALTRGWNFSNGTGLSGTFHVVKYDAFISDDDGNGLHTLVPCRVWVGGTADCFTLEYRGNIENKRLFWIQFVCSNQPDATFNPCPPWSEAKVDRDPTNISGPFNLPFFLNERNNTANTRIVPGGQDVFTFKDRPAREIPLNRNDSVTWLAHLYLVEWDENIPGRVKIHNGTEWGFTISCGGPAARADLKQWGGVRGDFPDSSMSFVSSEGPPTPVCTIDFPTYISLENHVPTLRLMDISPDESKLYVADAGNNELVIIDASAGYPVKEITRVKVGTDPRDVAVTPDGKKVYVTNHFDNTVSVIDATNFDVIKTIPVDYLPWGIDASAKGKIFVANWGGLGPNSLTNLDKGSISVIDSTSDSVIKTIKINSTNTGGPWGMKSSPDGSWAAVTNDGTNELILLHSDTYETKNIDLGVLDCTFPWDLEITEDERIVIACGDGPNFFPVIEVVCPEKFETFEQCEIDYSKRLEFEGDSAINEPWSVFAQGDKIYGVDRYNTAFDGSEQEEGSLLVWDANSLRLLEKVEHEHYPEIVGKAPIGVLVTSDGKIFVSSVGAHVISNKQAEINGTPFDYPQNEVGIIIDDMQIQETNTFVEYGIHGATLEKITPDQDNNSLSFSITTLNDGNLYLRLPHNVISSGSDLDDDFQILIDGNEIDHHEIKRVDENILSIPFTMGSETILVIGNSLNVETTPTETDSPDSQIMIIVAVVIVVIGVIIGTIFVIRKR